MWSDVKTKQSYLRQPSRVNLNRSTFCLKVQYIAAIVQSPLPLVNLWFLSLPRHYAVAIRITSSLMVAAMELSPLYRTFQVYKFGNRKYNFLLNYFVVLNVWHGFVFCKIPISIPLNIETSIPRYFARRYTVRCWYRVPVYSPNQSWLFLQFLLVPATFVLVILFGFFWKNPKNKLHWS